METPLTLFNSLIQKILESFCKEKNMKKLIVLMAAVSLFSFSAVKADATTIISLSGGYNFASGDTIDYFQYYYGGMNDWSKGGGAVHLDAWFGTDQLQAGIGIGFTSLFSISDRADMTSTYGEWVTWKATFAYIPITAQVRFFPLGGLYVGALAGYYYPAIIETVKGDSGTEYEPTTDTGESVFGAGLMVGYEMALIDFLVLGVQVRYQIVWDVEDVNHNTALMLTAGVKF